MTSNERGLYESAIELCQETQRSCRLLNGRCEEALVLVDAAISVLAKTLPSDEIAELLEAKGQILNLTA